MACLQPIFIINHDIEVSAREFVKLCQRKRGKKILVTGQYTTVYKERRSARSEESIMMEFLEPKGNRVFDNEFG